MVAYLFHSLSTKLEFLKWKIPPASRYLIKNLAKSGFEFTCLKNNDQTEDLGIESPHKKRVFFIPFKLVCFPIIKSNPANQMAEFLDGHNFNWLTGDTI